MKTAHRIRMNPTPEQVEYLKGACGTRRFIYNWGRDQWEKQYQAYKAEQETVPQEQHMLKPPNALTLKKHFNEIREQEYPWTYQVTKCVLEGAFDDLRSAYENFFAGRANYPGYKKKGKSHESFYLSNEKFTLGSHWISIPGLGRFILDQRHTKKDRGKLLRTLGQLLQFLKTKVANAGGELFIASRWFPSTKRCSCCGHVKKRMPLKHRTYQCLVCGLVIDRDLNAALNLLWFANETLRQLHAKAGRPG
jgi:transposase